MGAGHTDKVQLAAGDGVARCGHVLDLGGVKGRKLRGGTNFARKIQMRRAGHPLHGDQVRQAGIGVDMAPHDLILRGWAWQALSALTASLAVTGVAIAQALKDGVSAFKGARADSTRVRETLQLIAGERWRNEAFWFGHGTVHPGAHVVEYMPIGSHHTWWGLLFVKGLVGMLALLVPLVWQTALALLDAARHPRGRLPLSIMMTIVLLSFGENVEIEAYMLWPGLLVLGEHAARLRQS